MRATLILLGLGLAPLGAQERFDLDALMDHVLVQDLAVGPQGVVVQTLWADPEEDSWMSDLRISRDGRERRIPEAEGGDSLPTWSPDGETLAFLRDGRKGRSEVWLWAAGRGARRGFRFKGSISEFAWSPRGDRIAFIGTPIEERRAASDLEYEPYEVKHAAWRADGEGFDLGLRSHLYVVQLEQGKITPLTSGDFEDSVPAWSPDGKRIAFSSSRGDHRHRSYDRDLYWVSAEGGEPHRLTEGRTEEEIPVWSPDGQWLAFTGTTEADLYAANRYLCIMRPDGSESRMLTRSLDRSLAVGDGSGEPIWLDGSTLFVALEVEGRTDFARVTIEGEITKLPTEEPALFAALHRTGDGRIVALRSDSDEPPRPVTIEIETDRIRFRPLEWTDPNPTGSFRFSTAESFRVPRPDGVQIEAWRLPVPDGREQLGTLLHVHGGPNARFDEAWHPEHQVWAASGYQVIYANPRGSTGYGQAFCNAVHGEYGQGDFHDLMAVLDEVVEREWADPQRLYLTGYSYGGIMANWAVTQTDRFRAVVSGAGLSNYLACYGVDDCLVDWEAEFGPPWENPQKYLDQSPAMHAEQVETPILLLHGAEDIRCPASQSAHFYALLNGLGVDCGLVLYPEESHDMMAYPSNSRDYQERLLDWFQRH